ncbi:uncharacterized protein LOC112153600 isoform X1 [Oryzias melastigma]|uniref:Ig-like domain-containing protein n=1 Tax=Oryzias melastigma TaxID=30732 RepID=A0A3B3DFB8_ORYME|nr:uncharacterized protein LOC112153600 isoform X1 [Oryzias melastigma]
MMRGLSAFILLHVFTVVQNLELLEQISAKLGDNVTLTCLISGVDDGLFFWYKFQFGYKFQKFSSGNFGQIKLDKQFDNPRFNIVNVGSMYSLDIRHVRKDDEGTYFCQAGAAYKLRFLNGSRLVVKDSRKKPKPFFVHQSSNVEAVFLGQSVNLLCSVLISTKDNSDQCSGTHRVYWYRAGSESHPHLIYTTSSSCDVQNGRICIHNMTKTIRSLSDSGVYYCAVVSCGEILFGERTKVQIKQLCLPAIIIGALLACCTLVNIILIGIKTKQQCDHCKEDPVGQDRSSEDY